MRTKIIAFILVAGCAVFVAGCSATRPSERENLADPLMERESVFAKQALEQKFFLTREGSIGGSLGIGGGCGCAK